MNLLSLIPGGLLCILLFVFLFVPIVMYIFNSFKRRLDLIEISLLSLTLSLVLVPLIAWILNLILPFNYLLLVITFTIPFAISLFLILTKRVTLNKELLHISKSSLIILFIVFIAFFIRAQSLSSFFYEFDPYWYGIVTEFLIEDGFIPIHDGLGFSHTGISGHRALPLTHHLTSVWYLIFAGDTYNNLQNAYIMNLYPPLLGGLMAFWAFFFFKEEYGKWIGIAAAIILAFTPVLLQKFMAGVAEQLPWGLAFGLAGIVFLHFAIEGKNRRMYIPFLVMLIGALLGSKAGMLPLLVGIAYIGLRALKDFILKRQNKVYYELSLAIVITVLLMNFLYTVIYTQGNIERVFIDEEFLFALFTFLVSFFFYYFDTILSKLNLNQKALQNRLLLTGMFTILGILFLFTLGSPLLNYITNLAQVGMVHESALMKTVAEENLYSGMLNERFGAMGLSASIGNYTKLFMKEGYSSFDALPLIFLILFLLLIPGFFLEGKNHLLLIFIFVVGISFIGLQKVKYTPHLGLVLAIALITVAGEISNFIIKFTKENDNDKDENEAIQLYINYFMFFIIFIFLIMCLYSMVKCISPIQDLFSTGFVTFAIISSITLVVIYYLISKIYKGKLYDGAVSLLLLLFILPYAIGFIELIPYSISYLSVDGTNYTEVSDFCQSVAKDGSSVGIQFYCPIIPEYWYDVLMFMRDETPEDTRFLSWWDYGHWTNFYGERKTVTRNDHPAGAEENEVVADKFVANNERALREYMDKTGSTYVFFDQDLISKWGALTYLSCVHNKETPSDTLPQNSICSASYQFERVYIPQSPGINERCMIGDTYGIIGYSSFDDRGYCILNNVQGTFLFDITTNEMVNAIPVNMGSFRTGDGRILTEALMIYLPGDLTSAPGRGYNSVYYKAFFLGELEGFEQVYPPEKGIGIFPVRIYKKV